MGEHVIGIEFRQALRHGNGIIVALQILQGAGQAVHGFGEGRVGAQRLLIRSDGLVQMALGHKIERGVVVIFSLLAGVGVRHAEKFQAETGF